MPTFDSNYPQTSDDIDANIPRNNVNGDGWVLAEMSDGAAYGRFSVASSPQGETGSARGGVPRHYQPANEDCETE